MRLNPRLSLITLLISVFVNSTHASANELTLDSAIRLALENNPAIASAQAHSRQADARLKQARGSLLPRLNLDYSYNNTDNPLDIFGARLMSRSVDPAIDFATADALNEPDDATVETTRLGLVWPIYTGGQRLAGIAGARAMQQASEQGYRFSRELLRYQVTAAYRGLQASSEQIHIAEQAVSAAEKHVRTTRRLSREGRIIKSDQLTAEVYLSRMQGQLEQARLQHKLAQQQLLTLINHNEAFDKLSQWQWPQPAVANEQAALLTQAGKQRPDLQAAMARVDAARASVKKSRGKLHPQVGVVANRDRIDSDFGEADSWNAGAYVKFNLFNGGNDYYGIRAEQQALIQAEQQLKLKRLRVNDEVTTAIQRMNTAAIRLHIARNSSTRALEAVSRVQRRYGQGRTILIDLLQAEGALVTTRSEALSAALDYEIALAALALASGEHAKGDKQ